MVRCTIPCIDLGMLSRATVPFWDQLPKGGVVVDVGGGIGSTTMALADAHKHLRYIVQDRGAVIKDGIAVTQSG